MARLLARSYAMDVARDATAKKLWGDAFRALHEGDYYMGIMVDRALARELTPWWWKFRWS